MALITRFYNDDVPAKSLEKSTRDSLAVAPIESLPKYNHGLSDSQGLPGYEHHSYGTMGDNPLSD